MMEGSPAGASCEPTTSTKWSRRVLMVLKKLPLSVKKVDGQWQIAEKHLGPIVSTVRLMTESTDEKIHFKNFLWIGGLNEELEFENEEDRVALETLLREKHNSVPIFIDEMTRDGWVAFCKRCLWPLLNSQLVTNKFNATNSLWKDYKICNEVYAQAIKNELLRQEKQSREDLIWVHDYHLLLLPSRLRSSGVSNRIGFFFHTPFPTSEIFRILPERAKLLEGVLGSDLIGFQTYHDCRHFLSACTRILALDARPKGVEYHGHTVAVDIFPVGIDPAGLEKLLEDPRVLKRFEELKRNFAGTKLIMGRDRLDYIKGIPQKLLAFEDLLSTHPEWQGKVVLFQVCLPPSESFSHSYPSVPSIEMAQELQSQINELVGRINGAWGTADFTPIHYLNKSLPLEEVVSLYRAADVALLTPLRDGMNLTSHEYVVCQKDRCGPLILSEFAGSAQSLGGAVLVNPWDTRGVSSAIHEVLKMSEEEKKVKHDYNFKYILRNTALLWGNTFLRELVKAEVFHKVPRLKNEDVIGSYGDTKKRVFMLDYDGTLTPIVKNPPDAVPSSLLLRILERLCKDESNVVYVISGRDRDFLQQHLGNLPVGLSCEHGIFFRAYGTTEWDNLLAGMEFSWREVIMPILEDYTERTPGSMIETKEVNVTWHYRNAEEDFGSFQAKELVVHLQNVASKLPIEILMGKKAIEIRPQNVNKGATVRKIMALNPEADFVFCAGDDKTDEDMFAALPGVKPDVVDGEEEEEEEEEEMEPRKKKGRHNSNGLHCFTCVVNKQDSSASYFIGSQMELVKLLKRLAKISHKKTQPQKKENENEADKDVRHMME